MNAIERHALTPAQFGDLAEVPPELEWFPNISRSTMARLSRLYERRQNPDLASIIKVR